MRERPFVTLVCGFGRCGSSLIMQMLDAGGIPGTGSYPAFEADEAIVVLDGGTLDAARRRVASTDLLGGRFRSEKD